MRFFKKSRMPALYVTDGEGGKRDFLLGEVSVCHLSHQLFGLVQCMGV